MKPRESIIVSHLPEFGNTEIHRGTSVARDCPRHWHEQLHFCAIESGGGELFYRGAWNHTPASSLFIVHPGEVHANRAYNENGCTYRNLYIDSEWLRISLTEIIGAGGLPFFRQPVLFGPEVINKYQELLQVLERSSALLERESLFLNLFAMLVTNHAAEKASVRKAGREREAVSRARDFMNENYTENVSLDRLAKTARLSPFHFSRVFSLEVGIPPHAFQTQVRVAKAKKLLRDGGEISEVAASTGFADQSHLTRHFKRLVGVTPGEYKKGGK